VCTGARADRINSSKNHACGVDLECVKDDKKLGYKIIACIPHLFKRKPYGFDQRWICSLWDPDAFGGKHVDTNVAREKDILRASFFFF